MFQTIFETSVSVKASGVSSPVVTFQELLAVPTVIVEVTRVEEAAEVVR